jgi:Protein of unknown function (DUF2510)
MSYPTIAQSFSLADHWQEILIVAVVLLLILLFVQRAVRNRSLKVRRASTSAYYDPDVANYGSGPGGFAGAPSARNADGTSLAPTFAASNPTRGGGGTPSPPVSRAPAAPTASMPAPAPVQAPAPSPASFGPPPSGPMVGGPPPPQSSGGASVATLPPPTPTAPAGAPPEGWLPDPSGAPDTVRYWNGSAWTEHTAQRS